MEVLDHRVMLDEEPTDLDVVINHIKVIPEDSASRPHTVRAISLSTPRNVRCCLVRESGCRDCRR